MKTQFLPKDKDGRLDHACEEMAEALLARFKWRRFGAHTRWPFDDPAATSNMEDFLAELKDVQAAITACLPDLEEAVAAERQRIAEERLLHEQRIALNGDAGT